MDSERRVERVKSIKNINEYKKDSFMVKKSALKSVKKSAKNLVTKDDMIGEALKKNPMAAFILMKHGFHCVGCHAASFETIAQGAQAHGLSAAELKKIVDEINKSK
jgi:hybrid cluster-associated redox disulfide protein